MAASTIPNSGGPGSSVELSPVTIAVRDKVIEKFADQPLDEMNESVKQLLFREEDEQKRLGILAARVYILRQRIMSISEANPDRVVGSASPKTNDMMTGGIEEQVSESSQGEWTRLRIIDDCEVNGVRFPKTVIIDVRAEDAEKLIANGNAELIEEDPVSSMEQPAANMADDITGNAAEEAAGDAMADLEPPAEMPEEMPAETAFEAGTEDMASSDLENKDTAGDDMQADSADELSALSAALESAPASEMEVEEAPEAADEEESAGEAVIDAPSAAEVTAALEALGADNMSDDENEAVSAKTIAADAAADAADVAAELEALSASLGSSDDDVPASEMASDAADVAAELQAAAAAMAADAPDTDAEDQLSASGQDMADQDADKPGGWFEAQQKAEQPPATDTMADETNDESGEDEEDSDNAKP